jgi:hypothetical protein
VCWFRNNAIAPDLLHARPVLLGAGNSNDACGAQSLVRWREVTYRIQVTGNNEEDSGSFVLTVTGGQRPIVEDPPGA